MKIEFPIIIYLDGLFTADSGVFFKAVGAKFLDDDRFSIYENRRRNMKAGWIIDYTGKFIELQPQGKSREWLRPIAALFWNFVRSEYSAKSPRSVTVAEISERVAAFPKRERERQIVSNFLRVLATEEPDTKLSMEVLQRLPL